MLHACLSSLLSTALLFSFFSGTISTNTTLSQNDFLVTGLEELYPVFGSFDGTMHAGRIPIDSSEKKAGKLMFWLYQPTLQQEKMVIWLNGGPGCSSFGGMLFENAPVTIPHYKEGTPHTPPNPPLEPNSFAWTREAIMLYVEQPAGTGFSTGRMPRNETDVSSDFHGFLTNFYKVFPALKDKELYIFGESYAGMYVPSIARKIYLENKQAPLESRIPLSGIALGNGWIDATVQGPAVIDFAWWHGLIDFPTKEALHKQFESCWKYGNVADNRLHPFTTPDECGTMEAVQAAAGKDVREGLAGFNIYDVTTWDIYPVIYDPKGTLYQFFNMPEVQDALHAPRQYWHLCLPGEGRRRLEEEKEELMLDHDEPVSVVPYIAELLDEAKIRVLIYNGNLDISCCAQGSEMLLDSMKWSGSGEWKSAQRGLWLVENEPAGYSRKVDNLEFVVVYNSGHLMPMNQPENALDLVHRMVNGKGFQDAILPVFEAPPSTKTIEGSTSWESDSATDSTSDTDTQNDDTVCPTLRRRHTGFLILFSVVVGFAGGVIVTIRYHEQESQRRQRQGYRVVPEVETAPLPPPDAPQYPWRWWTSHHPSGRGQNQENSH